MNSSPRRSGIFLIASADAATLDDAALVAGILAGDVSLFETLMRRHNQRLYRTALAIVGASDAEDVLQQSYLDAFMHLAQLEDRANVAAWLTRIVVNGALALLAKRRRSVTDDADLDNVEAPATHAPEHLATREELRCALESAVGELPDGYRAAFVLRDVENLSTREAADYLSITEEALKVRLHRARAIVKARLGRDVPELVADVFAFGLVRCDRMVITVLDTVAPHVLVAAGVSMASIGAPLPVVAGVVAPAPAAALTAAPEA